VVAPTYRYCERCGGSPNLHPVRHIEHGKLCAWIDVEIADLVLACWQAGITTSESCQSYGDLSGVRSERATSQWVFLLLPIADAERFANAVLDTGDVALYERMSSLDVPDRWLVPVVSSGVWRYQPGVQIRLAFRVRYLFPHTEVPLLISRLRAWSASRGDSPVGADRGPKGTLPIVVPRAP
jgi:hypothetical protein